MNHLTAVMADLRRPPAPGMKGALRLFFGQPPMFGRKPGIFLDRDGVINERIVDGYVTRWEEFRLAEGVLPALRALSRFGAPILVVSNQAGVAKGLMGRRALCEITRRFVKALARAGCRIDAVYYCPHADRDACPCRKPEPGLILQAARDWRLDLGRSVMVGDSVRDIEAGRRAGCRGILLECQRQTVAAGLVPEPSRPPMLTARTLADLPGRVASLLGRCV